MEVQRTPAIRVRRRQRVLLALEILGFLSLVALRYYSPIFVARSFAANTYHRNYTAMLDQVCADQHDAYAETFKEIKEFPMILELGAIDPSRITFGVANESLTNATLTEAITDGDQVGYDHITLEAAGFGWCISDAPPVLVYGPENYVVIGNSNTQASIIVAVLAGTLARPYCRSPR